MNELAEHLAFAGSLLANAILLFAWRKHASPAAKAERLEEHATNAVLYAEQVAGDRPPAERMITACAASIAADRKANGKQDWSDAQHRIAVEVAVAKRKAAKEAGAK